MLGPGVFLSSSHGQLHGRFTTECIWVFLSVAVFRINWAGVICAGVVLSRICQTVHECQETFLNSLTPISARFGNGVCGLVGILFTFCIQ